MPINNNHSKEMIISLKASFHAHASRKKEAFSVWYKLMTWDLSRCWSLRGKAEAEITGWWLCFSFDLGRSSCFVLAALSRLNGFPVCCFHWVIPLSLLISYVFLWCSVVFHFSTFFSYSPLVSTTNTLRNIIMFKSKEHSPVILCWVPKG